MIKVISVSVFISFIISVSNVAEAKGRIYEFYSEAGEGQLELFKINISIEEKSGELCFLRTEDVNFPIKQDLIEKIKNSDAWTKYIHMEKQPHYCVDFLLYSIGWFYTEPVKVNLDEEYLFFFTGTVKKGGINGILHEFRRQVIEGDSLESRDIETIHVNKLTSVN